MMARKNNRFVFQNETEESRTSQQFEGGRTTMEDNQSNNHSDNPGLVLVTNMLTRDNFLPRCQALQRALIAKEKLKYITDDLKPKNRDSVEYK